MTYEDELRKMPSKVLIDELFDALDIEPVSAELLHRLEERDRLREALREFALWRHRYAEHSDRGGNVFFERCDAGSCTAARELLGQASSAAQS